MKQKHRDKWLDRCAVELSYCYRLCVTEKEFHKELKRLDLPKDQWPAFVISTHANATCHFFQHKDGQKIAIVCLPKREGKTKTLDQVCGLLVHEAMHIWRECRVDIGETNPSHEFEAYAMQRISQNLIWAWLEQIK